MQAKNDALRIQARLNLKKERDKAIYDYLDKLPTRSKTNFVLDAVFAAIQRDSLETMIKQTIENTLNELLDKERSPSEKSSHDLSDKQFETVQNEVSPIEVVTVDSNIDDDVLSDFGDFLQL